MLALDTATRATAVALCPETEGATLEGRDDPPAGSRPRHTSRLMPLIAEALERGGVAWTDIDRIAVGRGPGTFTGLRIGIATARALARSIGCPLVGVSTLESLALGVGSAAQTDARAATADVVVAVLDARRREAFAAAWRVGDANARDPEAVLGKRLLAPCAIAPGALAELLPDLGSATLALGEGALEFRDVLEGTGAVIPMNAPELHRVTAANHCRLAARRDGSTPEEIQPEYLRLPDAEIAKRATGSR